jgi:integrase
MGHIYKRGNIYWIKYYRNGKPYRETTRSKKEADAKRLIKRREGEISQGKLPGIYFDKVLFNDLAENLLTDYLINDRKTKTIKNCIAHLYSKFDGMRVVQITVDRIKEYIENRLSDGAANATINRELSALKRMLNLGVQQGRVDRMPYIPMLKENNVRKGFFEHGDFIALRDALPDYLKPFVTFAHKVGWRSSEISKLKWSQVDLANGIVRLEVGDTKNDEGRTVYLDSELRQMFKDLWDNRKTLIPYVFPNKVNTGPIANFRPSWNNACRKAGLGYGYRLGKQYVEQWQDKLPAGPILHDFRRTAARNMVRAGVPERVAMMVTGHKTRSVFDRYNIVSDSDLKLAAQKQQTYLDSQKGTATVTILDFESKKQTKSAT